MIAQTIVIGFLLAFAVAFLIAFFAAVSAYSDGHIDASYKNALGTQAVFRGRHSGPLLKVYDFAYNREIIRTTRIKGRRTR